jgi:uncharacterized protein (DUF58 family)
VSLTVTHGIHGRRRPGTGDTFWQFRHYQAGDARTLIDWRRSGSSDHLFVREREWEAAHTVWLWPDISPSMRFQSRLAPISKRDRALVLMFAAAELLVAGGERVGLIGLMPPSIQRNIGQRMAERLLEHEGTPAGRESLPPHATLMRFSECILLSDFLEPVEAITERITAMASQGVHGHLVQILDPAEETLPYSGRTEFLDMEGSDRMLANRAESLREQYVQRLAAHRAALQELAHRHEWSLLTHRTDQPAEQALLMLHARVSGEVEAYRYSHEDGALRGGAT